MIAKEELIEYARYVENYYGTPRTYVEQQLETGKECDSWRLRFRERSR